MHDWVGGAIKRSGGKNRMLSRGVAAYVQEVWFCPSPTVLTDDQRRSNGERGRAGELGTAGSVINIPLCIHPYYTYLLSFSHVLTSGDSL